MVGWLRRQIREALSRELMTSLYDEVTDPMLPRKASKRDVFQTVPQTNAGGRGEYPKALEKTLVKELGKMTP